jgi:hypothetical protein
MTHTECDYTFRLAFWSKVALDIQAGCNLSGIVMSFAEMVQEMRASGMDTKECNNHPLTRLFADKLYELSDIDHANVSRAYDFAAKHSEDNNAS